MPSSPATPSVPIVFYSYARVDQRHVEALRSQLSVLSLDISPRSGRTRHEFVRVHLGLRICDSSTHDGPATGFTQRVQAITPHQPRSAGLLDDLREITRLVFGLPCGEARSGVKIGRGRPLTSLLLGPGEAGG